MPAMTRAQRRAGVEDPSDSDEVQIVSRVEPPYSTFGMACLVMLRAKAWLTAREVHLLMKDMFPEFLLPGKSAVRRQLDIRPCFQKKTRANDISDSDRWFLDSLRIPEGAFHKKKSTVTCSTTGYPDDLLDYMNVELVPQYATFSDSDFTSPPSSPPRKRVASPTVPKPNQLVQTIDGMHGPTFTGPLPLYPGGQPTELRLPDPENKLQMWHFQDDIGSVYTYQLTLPPGKSVENVRFEVVNSQQTVEIVDRQAETPSV